MRLFRLLGKADCTQARLGPKSIDQTLAVKNGNAPGRTGSRTGNCAGVPSKRMLTDLRIIENDDVWRARQPRGGREHNVPSHNATASGECGPFRVDTVLPPPITLAPSLPWRQANSPGVLLHYPLDDEAHATCRLDFSTPFAQATNACCPSAPM